MEQFFSQILDGAFVTLFIFSITLLLSLPLGLVVANLRRSKFKPLANLMKFYIWLMRGTPLLLQLMFVFFGLPFVGIVLQRFPAAIIAMVLNYTAYFAEIMRGGMDAVDQGQIEAGTVLGISKWHIYTRIVLPQMWKTIMPSIGNEVITLLKDTSLVYVLGIGELLRAGQIAANTLASLTPFIVVGILYLLFTAILTLILNKIEKRFTYES